MYDKVPGVRSVMNARPTWKGCEPDQKTVTTFSRVRLIKSRCAHEGREGGGEGGGGDCERYSIIDNIRNFVILVL